MKVMFDSSVLFHANRGGGVYNYLIKFLPALEKKVKSQGGNLDFLRFYFREKANQPEFINEANLKEFRFPVKALNFLWTSFGIPDMSWFYKDVDIIHSPHFSLPVMSKAKKVLTVNDIAYLRQPEYYSESGKTLNDYGYKKLLPVNVKRANKLIAISQFTKNDIMDYFKISDDKISVVHIGCDIPNQLEADNLSRILKGLGIDGYQYIYFPAGTFEPRKNIERTVSAFNRLNGKLLGLRLVISGVGERSWLGNHISSGNIVFVKWNTDDERNALYQGSLFVAYPSLYEGFGMPVVEAMGNGKAILTSASTSLKEIAEGYAHMVDPENINEISEGIEAITVSIAYRKELEDKSKIRAMAFTWEIMTEKTYEVYRKLINL